MVKRPAIITGATVVFCALLCSGIVFADDDASVDDVSIVVPTACTLSGTGTGTHTATINPGQYVADIGTTTLKAICNDANGFAIYATGYTGNTIGETNSNKLVGQNTAETIATGLATSGDTSNWAMKLATDPNATYPVTIESAPNTSGGSSASFANYHVVPNEYTKVATRLQSTDVGTTATGSTLTTTYATYISAGQVGDTYNGKVIYTLVHPNDHATPVAPLLATDCPANKICYAPNANDIDGSMESISSTKITKSPTAGVQNAGSNGTYVLIAPNYSREGYGFAGWSTDYNASSSSIVYGPNETITTSTTVGSGDADVSTNGLILYPVWVASAGNIQNWTGCSTLNQATYNSTTGKINATLASVTALTDERDGNVYTVARLADGNCWMTENLRLNAENTRSDADKDLAQGYGDDTANNRGKFIGLADSEDTSFTGDSSTPLKPANANSLYYASSQSGTATMDVGQVGYADYRIPRYNNNNTNLAPDATNSAGTALIDIYYSSNNDHARWYGYGNYYNWPASLASTTYYSGPTATVNDYTSETVGTSICPTGWKLPYGRGTSNGTTSGSFSYLDSQLGGTGSDSSSSTNPTGATMSMRWRSFPNNFTYSGYFGVPSANDRGAAGSYWSSTARSGYTSSSMSLDSSYIHPGSTNSGKVMGYSVRCIAGS